jgi:hypothetical protein
MRELIPMLLEEALPQILDSLEGSPDLGGIELDWKIPNASSLLDGGV